MSNKKLLLTVICAALLCIVDANVFSQLYTNPETVAISRKMPEPMIKKTVLKAGSAKSMQMTNAWLWDKGFTYDYLDNYLYFSNAQNPFTLTLETQVVAPVKVKYSLYTYKKTFSQDGKRGFMQGITECGLVNPITTQEGIDKNLDKIYEFPAVTETASGQKELPWYGYTDPKFTGGQKYAVRDCLYISIHNADTGELLDTQITGNPAQIYQAAGIPGIKYRIDTDANNKQTISGTIVFAYSDSWPIKKITALLTTESCGYGALPISVVNQGADAIAADINRRLPGDVVAHVTLTNPTVDKDNPNIKIFDWKDIKTEDGKDFVPDWKKYSTGYKLAIIIEMDEMTYTGIKNGFISSGTYYIPDVGDPVRSFTDIEDVKASKGMKITQTPTGFKVDCDGGVCANKLTVYNTAGGLVKQVALSGTQSTQEVSTELRDGVYIVKTDGTNNGRPESATLKVVKKN
jgi:hypothetical protein